MHPDVRVAERAAEEWGVLSLAELHQCGLSTDAVRVRARNGRLHRMHRAVYAVGHANLPVEGRFLAAVKACGPGAVLSHYSAAALWGVVDWDGRRIEVTVVGTATRLQRHIKVHRASILHPEDRMRRDGIPVTAPARTLLDLATVVDPRSLRRAVRRAQSLQRLRIRHLVDVIHRAGRRQGVRVLSEIVVEGPAPTRSELEDAVLDLLLRGGVAPPRVNAPLMLSGRRVIPDFRWPQQRLVLEADGAEWHGHRVAREDDAERQALLEAHGERVVRLTWRQVTARPAQTLARIRAAGAPFADPLSS